MLKVNDLQFRWCHKSTGTECILFNGEQSEVVGRATLSSKDKLVKELGRKISLRRALHNLRFNKEQRTEIWEKYRTSKAVPRW